MDKIQKLLDLKNKRNAIILAHYYQDPDIQDVADWTACYPWKDKIIPQPKSDYVYFNEDDNIHWSYGLSTKQKVKITRLLLLALDELHFLNVVHGDIKTANVVLHNQKKNQLYHIEIINPLLWRISLVLLRVLQKEKD